MTLYGDRVILKHGDWDEEDVRSKREYIHYEVMAAEVEDRSYNFSEPHKRAKTLTLYVDTETGLVTADIPLFEKWMEGRA